MSLLNHSLLLGADAGAAGGYQISRSLRFNSSDSAYLSRTPASAGNRKTWTFAFWIKRTKVATEETILDASASSSYPKGRFGFTNGDKLNFFWYDGSTAYGLDTAAIYRDFSAWYHVVLTYDSTQSTSSNRTKIYVNGVQQDVSGSYVAQNTDADINNTVKHVIGYYQQPSLHYINSYLADVHLVDGQALTPSSFGEFDANGIWQPKAYTGTYGTNGFHLPFSDNSTAAALGTDTSGNGNTWTVNNISAAEVNYRQYLTAVNTSFSNSAANAFDGNTATYATVAGDASNSSSSKSKYMRWSPSPPIAAGKTVEIYTHQPDPVFGYRWYQRVDAQGNSTSTVGLQYPGSRDSWVTVSTNGLQTLDLWADQNQGGQINAIRIDGTLLIETLGSNVDSLIDSPTNYGTDTGAGGEVRGNYCTWNPLRLGPSASLANGNLDWSKAAGSNYGLSTGTVALPLSGKWYWEITPTSNPNPASGFSWYTGVSETSSASTNYLEQTGVSCGYIPTGTIAYNGGSASYGSTYTTNDVIGVAVDMDNGAIYFSKNGTWQNSGVPTSGASKTGAARTNLSGASLYPSCASNDSSYTFSAVANFGQRPFAYTAPSGFKALCTTNLPAPTGVVAQPSTAFDVKLYTGNGSTQTISGLGFSPDLVWVKQRSAVRSNWLTDTVRGNTKLLSSDQTAAEITETDCITAFNSDGFSLDADAGFNANAGTYAAWCWDAGSSTVTNTQGSITSSVRANASAGFSIVTYTGTGANATVGHGLGVAPSMIIVKSRNTAATNWGVYHSGVSSTPQNSALNLDNTSAIDTQSVYWNNTAPTSSVFSVGTWGGSNGSTRTYVAYCFAPVAGYSSFGSYTGNGSSDGPFVWTGFRPRWILFKKSSASQNWHLIDTARDPYNIAGYELYTDLSNSESSGFGNLSRIDVVSNGFKIRTTNDGYNGNSGTYVYAAFAESPFQFARAR